MNYLLRLIPILAILLWAGCSTPEQNPTSPRENTGYVDFYTDSDLVLSWEIKKLEQTTDRTNTVFNQFEPISGNILRLASAPGKQRFQVWFINRATTGPQYADVDLENGKVTPVHVLLRQVGTATVDREDQAVRGSAKGFGRRKKFTFEENALYAISTPSGGPQPYRPKEQMPYWSSTDK